MFNVVLHPAVIKCEHGFSFSSDLGIVVAVEEANLDAFKPSTDYPSLEEYEEFHDGIRESSTEGEETTLLTHGYLWNTPDDCFPKPLTVG